jgi:chromatin remodeling complex protein RSC6
MSANSSSATGIMNTATKTSAKKVTKKTDETVAAPAPVVAAAAPKVEAKAETKVVETKAKAVKAVKAETKVEAPVVVAAPAVATEAVAAPAAVAAVVVEERVETKVKAHTAQMLAIRETLSALITQSKKLEKEVAKLQKAAEKRRRRKAGVEGVDGAVKVPCAFTLPCQLSADLCSFMNVPAGSQESRSNVTKYLTTYFKEHDLKNKHDIKPDAKLKKLLDLKDTDKLTYFNLQKFLNPHYIKNTPSAASAAATATA